MSKGIFYSFSHGWDKLTRTQMREVRETIIRELHLTTTQAFYSKMKGVGYKSEYDIITNIFAQYGIPEAEVWRESNENAG